MTAEMKNHGRRIVGVRSIFTPKKLLIATLQLMKSMISDLHSSIILSSHRNRISAVFNVASMLILVYMNSGSEYDIHYDVIIFPLLHCIVYTTFHIHKGVCRSQSDHSPTCCSLFSQNLQTRGYPGPSPNLELYTFSLSPWCE